MRILFVIGVPGCGKSTLMLKILEGLGPCQTKRFGLLDYMEFEQVNVLGKYETGDVFGGTDRLSNAVINDAEQFLSKSSKAILLEGDRLANTRFIDKCKALGGFRLVILELNPALLKERRDARAFEYGKTQNPTWLLGRESKVKNLRDQFDGELWPVDNDEQVEKAVQNFAAWVRGGVVEFGEKPLAPVVSKLF